ncbi:MAG: molybdopterin-dependent oxidoreductase [Candidatus Protistobacter heckmanni]|nr:molybdopterin-dependent oxidoreductase [Candidatus Protistobacter heckmanni]
MAAYPTGCAVCEVEVDAGTGVSRILRYTSVDDVGKPINPMIVEGQVHGGLAQGIGQAFSEGYFVERDSGQVLIGSYMDYGVPPLAVALTEDPTAGNPLGVKGGGESGITPATAVIFNALADALRGLGVDGEPPMPASPGALWDFMQGDKR